MKLNRIYAIIGSLLVLVPFLGFTREFKYGFSVLAGAIILYFAINSIHIELRKKHRRPHRYDTFVENKPVAQSPEVISEAVHEVSIEERALPVTQEVIEEKEL